MRSLRDYALTMYRYDLKLRHLLDEFSIDQIATEVTDWLKAPAADLRLLITFARDLAIGSDLTAAEKLMYVSALYKTGFFVDLSRNLYSDRIFESLSTIYEFGKFSQPENAAFLEQAYERRYRAQNPVLAFECLSELHWLNSAKVDNYLDELAAASSFAAKLTLLFYWNRRSYDGQSAPILDDALFLQLVLPTSNLSVAEHRSDLGARLYNFENYLANLMQALGRIDISEPHLEKVATDYFAASGDRELDALALVHEELLQANDRNGCLPGKGPPQSSPRVPE